MYLAKTESIGSITDKKFAVLDLLIGVWKSAKRVAQPATAESDKKISFLIVKILLLLIRAVC